MGRNIMDRMAILIGNERGESLVPMLEREGLRVEVTRSPEQALERLQQIMVRRGGGFSPETAGPMGPLESSEGGHGGVGVEQWPSDHGIGVTLDRRLAAVQMRAKSLEGEEQKIIHEALQQAGANKTAAARLLGISRYALQRRLRRFAKPQQIAGGGSGQPGISGVECDDDLDMP
jgi:transcriptional regulator with GAF, ATPase, and Fis domain